MKNLVLNQIKEQIGEFDEQVRKLVIRYITATASYLGQHYIDIGSSFINKEPFPDEEEVEADTLIELSRLPAETRSQLLHHLVLIRKLAFKEAAKRTSDETGDVYDLDGFSKLESCQLDALEKLESHFSAMPMNLSNENSLRELLQAKLRTANVHGLLDYLKDNTESSKLRSSETVYYLAEQIHAAIEQNSRTTPWDYAHNQKKTECFYNVFHKSRRSPLWFENHIPQHDGWALSLGDHLETLTPEECAKWRLLLQLSHADSGAKITSKFTKSAIAFTTQVTEREFTDIFNQIEASMRTKSPVWVWTAAKGIREESIYCDTSTAMLRAIIRLSPHYPNQRTVVSLERMLNHCFDKIAGIGPRSELLGQEAINALIRIPFDGKLILFKNALNSFKKNKLIKRRIEKAIDQCM